MEKNINLNGVMVRLRQTDKHYYVSLQDIAKGYSPDDWHGIINDWIKRYSTIEYMGLWEKLENDNFNYAEFDIIKNQSGKNSYRLSPTKWVQKTGAIGIIPGARGKYSKGAYAQKDIALHFCYWLEPQFQLYLTREFDRLKRAEQDKLGDPFNLKRHLVAGNFQFMMDAIRDQLPERLLTHPETYNQLPSRSSEADMLNQIVFGQTAKEWRKKNPDKLHNRNQRDYASIVDLAVMNNLEFCNAMLIGWEMSREEREPILFGMYEWMHPKFSRYKTMKDLQKLANKYKIGN